MAKRRSKSGDTFIQLNLDDSRVIRGLRSVQRRLGGIGKTLRHVGGVGLGVGSALTSSFGGLAKLFAATGDKLDKMSARTGVSVEGLQELGFAAEQTGTSMDSVEKGIRGMNRNLLDAERGLSTAVDNLSDLGMTVDDLAGLAPEEKLQKIVGALSKIEDPTRRSALAMKLFGRAGSDLLPLINAGPNGLADLRKEAHELGLVMGSEDTQAAASFSDAMNRVWRQVKMVGVQVGAAIAGPLLQFSEFVTPHLTQLIEWVQSNRTLVVSVAAVGAGLIAAGTVAVGLGAAFATLSAGVSGLIALAGGLTAGFTALTSVAGVVATVVGAVASSVALPIAAFFALTEGIAYLLGFSSPLQGFFTWLGDLAGWAGRQLKDLLGSALGWMIDRVRSFLGWLGKAVSETAATLDSAEVDSADAPKTDTTAPKASEATVDDALAKQFKEAQEKFAELTRASNQESSKAQTTAIDTLAEDLQRKLAATAEGEGEAIERQREQLEASRKKFGELNEAAELAASAIKEEAKLKTESIKEATEAAQQATVGTKRGGTSAGAFNVAALSSILGGAGNESSRTAKATERTAQVLERIEKKSGNVLVTS